MGIFVIFGYLNDAFSLPSVDTSVVVGLGRDVGVVATVVPKDKNITKLYRSSILSKV